MNNLRRDSFSFAGNMKEKLFISQALENTQGFAVGMTNCRRLSFFLYLQDKSVSAEGLRIPNRAQECPGRMREETPHSGAGLSSSYNVTAHFQHLTNQL